DEEGNQSFGFYRPDYSPRKAAVYLHNLTTILREDGHVQHPGSLTYSLANASETVHDLLLQNSLGKYQLVIWNEKATGGDDVTLWLAKKAASIKIFDPVTGVTPIRKLQNENRIELSLTDHPVIIEL